jgi:hypothetical protein
LTILIIDKSQKYFDLKIKKNWDVLYTRARMHEVKKGAPFYEVWETLPSLAGMISVYVTCFQNERTGPW